MSERLKKSAYNMASSTLGFIAPMVVAFVVTPLLLHALGDAAYGIQVLASIIVGYFAVFDLGLDLPIIKFLAEDRAKKDIRSASLLLSAALKAYIAIGLLGAAITFAASGFLARSVFKLPESQVNQAIWVFRIAGIGFIFSLLLSWGRAFAIGIQRLDVSSGISGIAAIAGNILGLLAVYAGFGVVGYVFCRVAVTAAAGILFIFIARRIAPELNFSRNFERGVLKRISPFVGYGMVYRVTNAFLGRIDQVMLGIWIGVAQAGIYALAASIVPLVIQLLASTITMFVPLASELHGAKQTEYLRNIYIRYAGISAASTTMCFSPLFVFSDYFMRLWVGQPAAQITSRVFSFLLFAGYIGTLATILLVNMLIGLGRMKEFTLFMLARSLFLALACFSLIPYFGLSGAGIAQLLAAFVDVVFMAFLLPRILQINFFHLLQTSYFKPVFLGLSAAAVTWIFKPAVNSWFSLIFCVAFFELIYIVSAFIFKIFAETEKRAAMVIWQAVLHRAVCLRGGS